MVGLIGFVGDLPVSPLGVDVLPEESLEEDRAALVIDIQGRGAVQPDLQELVDKCAAVFPGDAVLPLGENTKFVEDLDVSGLAALTRTGRYLLAGRVTVVGKSGGVIRILLSTDLNNPLSKALSRLFMPDDLAEDDQPILWVNLRYETRRSVPTEIPSAIESFARTMSCRNRVTVFRELRVDPGALGDPPVDLELLLEGIRVGVEPPGPLQPLGVLRRIGGVMNPDRGHPEFVLGDGEALQVHAALTRRAPSAARGTAPRTGSCSRSAC